MNYNLFVIYALCVFFASHNIYLLVRNKLMRNSLNKNVVMDLELATSDQLFKELSNRNDSYILLRPIKKRGELSSIKIECNSLSRHLIQSVMVKCTKTIIKENKKIDSQD